MTRNASRLSGLLAAVVSVAGPAFAQETAPQTPPANPPANPPATNPANPQTPPTTPPATPPTAPANNTPPANTPPPASNPAPAPRPAAPRPAPPVVRKAAPPVKLPANVVARVGGRDITRDDVLGMVNMTRGRDYINALIDAALVEQEAKRLGVTVSEAEMKQGVQQAKDRAVQMAMMQGTPMTFAEIQNREGISDDLVRWSVRMNLLQRKAFSKAVEKQVPSRDAQVKLAHVLVANIPLPSSPNEQVKPLTPEEQKKKDEEAKVKADQLLADLKSGKITWDEAAKQSDDKSNNYKGGELDFYGTGQLDPAFEKAGFSIAKEGEIVGPIKSSFGYHLIKLLKKGKDLPAADKAAYRKQQTERLLSNPQMMQQWVASLRQEKPIVRNPDVKLIPGARAPFSAPAPAATRKAASR